MDDDIITVRDLINALSKCDLDDEVYFRNENGDRIDGTLYVSKIDKKKNKNKIYGTLYG